MTNEKVYDWLDKGATQAGEENDVCPRHEHLIRSSWTIRRATWVFSMVFPRKESRWQSNSSEQPKHNRRALTSSSPSSAVARLGVEKLFCPTASL